MSDDDNELAKLRKEVNELKQRLDPPPCTPFNLPRFDPTEGMSMPRSAMQAMIDAVPDALMRSLREDARRPNAVTGGAAPQSQPVQRGTGWAKPNPIESPPGIEHCDRMMDAQDRLDSAELALRLMKAKGTP